MEGYARVLRNQRIGIIWTDEINAIDSIIVVR